MLTLGVPALTLSLACAVAFSASDYFRKAVPSACTAPLVLFYMVCGQIPILAIWWISSGDVDISTAYIAPGIAAAGIGLAANLLLIVALRQSPLSLMIPLLGIIPAVTAIFSGLMLGEWPTTKQALGIGLVTVGLLALYSSGREKFSVIRLLENIRAEPGTRPMFAVVLLWSVAPPLDKLCVEYSSVGAHGSIQLFLIGLATGAWILATGGFRTFIAPRSAVRPLTGAAVSAGLAYGFQLAAYQIALVAIVELFKRAIGMIGSLILGRIMFNERITAPKLVGIAIMAMGLPLLMLP